MDLIAVAMVFPVSLAVGLALQVGSLQLILWALRRSANLSPAQSFVNPLTDRFGARRGVGQRPPRVRRVSQFRGGREWNGLR
jgi:hypothetical protein